MNCELVEELLSGYLDNVLIFEERRLVAYHLQSCQHCSALLEELHRNDALIQNLPRMSPSVALRERLFSSQEFLELSAIDKTSASENSDWSAPAAPTVPRLPAKGSRRDTPGRPQLVAIPGGRSTRPSPAARTTQQTTNHDGVRLRGGITGVMIAAIAAALILSLGIGGVIGYSVLSSRQQSATTRGITPPSGLPGTPPLSAGKRFVFLRGGELWSTIGDNSPAQPQRLTAGSVDVAPGWVVSNPPVGGVAGDMLAYIDLQTGRVHIIRSDGQKDTTINQPLLKSGIVPASVWDTEDGRSILGSLAWSPDGNSLAFIADPHGTGLTSLYVYSMVAASVTAVPVPAQGSVTHPSWSPDSARLAFEVTNKGVTSIIDYNVQNHGELTIADGIGAGTSAGESVLALDWSPDLVTPGLTWSVGSIGHVQSVWLHGVDSISSASSQMLFSGDAIQAIYSLNGHNGVGSWLVILSNVGQAGDIWRIDVAPGARAVALTSGRQVNFAQWSPDGSSIDYLDTVSNGVGTLHIVDASTAADWLIAAGIAATPAPGWSPDSQRIAFSTGTRVGIASGQQSGSILYLALKGAASVWLWSITSPNQLIVAMNDAQQGIFIADTQHGTLRQVDTLGTSGPLLWTQIP